MDEKQLQFLYNEYAKNKGFKDYSEFKGLMSSEESRKLFFDDANTDLGFKDYNEFNDLLGLKKKVGGEVSSPTKLPSISQEYLDKSQGLVDNSFLKQIGKQADSYQLISEYKSPDISLMQKPRKDYYSTKLEKGLIFDKEGQLYAPSSEALSKAITKAEEPSLKKSTQKDLVEQAREMPIEEPKKEGEWANIVQNVAANFELAGTKLAEGTATIIRDLSSLGIENPDLYDAEGRKTKYTESASWMNDPLGKVILGLEGNKHRMQDVIKNNPLPSTFWGNAVSEVASFAPDIAATALLPETKLAEGASVIRTIGSNLINNFTKFMTVKGGVEGYGEARVSGKDIGKAAIEGGKGAISGFQTGIEMAVLGAGSNLATKKIMQQAEKIGLTGAKGLTAKELVNLSTDVTAFGLLSPTAHAALEGRWVTAEEIASGTGIAALFRLKGAVENIKSNRELNKSLQETQELKQGVAISNFVDADPAAIERVYYTKESADELQLKALEAAKNAKETTDLQKKQQYIAEVMAYSKAANVKQVTEDIINNKDALRKFQESDLPDNIKQAFLEKAGEIIKQLDPLEQKKTLLGQDIVDTNNFIKESTDALNIESDPVKKMELQVSIEDAEKLLKDNEIELKRIIKEQNQPKQQEDLLTEDGIKNAQKEFNKNIDQQIKDLDKNNPDYQDELEALNNKKESQNEHYDTLLNIKAPETDEIKQIEVKPAEVKEEVNLIELENKKAEIEKLEKQYNDLVPIVNAQEKPPLQFPRIEQPKTKEELELISIGGQLKQLRKERDLIEQEVKPTKIKEIKVKPIEFSKTVENKYGITVDLTGDVEKGDLTLSRIEVPKDQRGKEIGTKAMEDIIKYADENNKRIVLTPSTDFGGTSVKRLKQFYKKFGFIENTGKNKDFTTKETMYRNPEVKLIEEVKPAEIPKEVYNPIVDKIRKGIQKLSDKAKISVLKSKNFEKVLEESIKTGGVNLQSWGGFEKKGFEESPQWQKLIDNGTVKLNFDIKGLEGKPVVVINPDNMLTGEVVTKNGKPIVDGNGGINFVTKFGDVWASSDNVTANTLARYINEARQKDIDAGGDGTVHVVVTKGDLSKSLTSHTGAKAAMKVLEYFVDKKLISLSDFRKALTEVGKKYNIDFDGRLDAKAIHDDISKKFFGVTDSTFSKRGFFVQDVIDNLAKNSKSAKENIGKIRELLNTEALPKSTERKTGEISFAKEGIIDAIGHLLSDNMTVGVKNSEAYATIEIKHPVEVFNLNKEEGGHESYPFHLRQIDENGNKVKPILNVLSDAKHVTDILNDANNNPVDKKGGAGKFGSNQIGMAKGFVKPAAEHPTGVNMMTDATGKIYGFEQNGKIVLNADLMNGNTPFHEAGHLWLSWAKGNRADLHDAGMMKIENSKYLLDVKNNPVYQENAAKLPESEREAYFKSEALAKAIGDNGEKFVTAAQKSDFKQWLKDLWISIADHFGLRTMSAEQISNMTLDEFSKKVVGDIIEAKPKEPAEIKNEGELKAEYENKLLSDGKSKKRQENVRKTIIDSNFDEIVKDLIRNNKIEKIC